MKKIFVLLGHPDNDSFNGALADAYVRGAKAAGHDVRITKIADMKFDPILHKGYRVIQSYEPDLVTFQENVRWSDHFVTIYPTWWSTMPAIMKGLLERVWMPAFGYRFWKGTTIPGWSRLLKGRTARVITTSDSRPLSMWFLFGTGNTNSYSRAILWFSGFSVRTTWFNGMKKSTPARLQTIISKVEKLGKKGK